MTDISKQRKKLREFSDLKIRDGFGAITIYAGSRDIAIIYKPSGKTQIDNQLYLEIPEPNRGKFNEVVLELKLKQVLAHSEYKKNRGGTNEV